MDAQAGRIQDASAHLLEAIQTATRIGFWFELLNGLEACGYLCAATGRYPQAITVWASSAALSRQLAVAETPAMACWRRQPLRNARDALGPDRSPAAEERGAAMTMAAAAEYALMLTDPGPPQPIVPGPGRLSAREREPVTLVAQGYTDAQIAVSCASASAPSARTWTGSGTRPAAAAAPN